jgi:hypothetical protein
MILHCLAEGNSVRGTARLCDVEKRTVLNLLLTAAWRCERFMDEKIRDMRDSDLELDECWSYVFKKEMHKRPNEKENSEIGDQYTFIAQDRKTRLAIAWHLGRRDQLNTDQFIEKVRPVTAPDQRSDVSTGCFCSL